MKDLQFFSQVSALKRKHANFTLLFSRGQNCFKVRAARTAPLILEINIDSYSLLLNIKFTMMKISDRSKNQSSNCLGEVEPARSQLAQPIKFLICGIVLVVDAVYVNPP